jgi:predicted transcriptional regulator
VLRYDNELGKGDHRHFGDRERSSFWRQGEVLSVLNAGPISVREVARRVDRDVKAVHGDVTALAAAGLVDRDDRGRVEFPFDAVKVEFPLQAA